MATWRHHGAAGCLWTILRVRARPQQTTPTLQRSRSAEGASERQWQERNKAFSGHDKKMEQFRTQFGTIKV